MADGGLGWMSVCRETEDCLHREIPRRMSGLIAYLRQEKAIRCDECPGAKAAVATRSWQSWLGWLAEKDVGFYRENEKN